MKLSDAKRLKELEEENPGARAPAGVYFVRLETGDHVDRQRCVLLD
jgi:hypothetical protein